jgi:hypothetical protein
MKFVIFSAAEAKLGALYTTAKKMVPLCQTLIEMGWPQPSTPIQMDNSTAVGVTNLTIVPQKKQVHGSLLMVAPMPRISATLKRVPAMWRSQMVCLSLSAGISGLELPETFVRGLLLSPNVQPPSWALLFSLQITLNV